MTTTRDRTRAAAIAAAFRDHPRAALDRLAGLVVGTFVVGAVTGAAAMWLVTR